LVSVDAFLDLPVGKKEKNMAFTAYSGLFSYNFDRNYLRNVGIINVGIADANYKGSDKFMAGAGNAQPMIGTGTIFYTQAGLLLPKTKEKPKLRVQPFAAYTMKNFEALPTTVSNFDMGANWLIDGHHAKITTQYALRPGIELTSGNKVSKGEFIMQLQVYL
jgi:hypothetical protein